MMTEYKIKEILRFHNGRGYDSISEHGLIPVYGSGGVMGYTDKSLLEGEYILLPRKGSLNNYFYINKPFWNVDTIYAADVVKDGVDCKYLYNYFKCLNLGNLDSGSTLPSMTQSSYGSIKVKLPSYDTQKTVVKFLTTIDDKISANNKIIETSERLMREIYNYWFVQFDYPDENGRPYKSSGGEMVYNEILKREIPKEWKVQNLLKNDLCNDIKPGIDKFDGKKTYYATADVINAEMGIGSQIDFHNRESRANMQPRINSIWFAKMKNSVKHMTVMPTSEDLLENSIFSTGFFGIECRAEALPYIRCFIYSDYFEKVKDLNSNGATMEAISNDGVKNIKLLVPIDSILRRFTTISNDCLLETDTLRKENTILASLRDWLLPMLMNGQVTVAA